MYHQKFDIDFNTLYEVNYEGAAGWKERETRLSNLAQKVLDADSTTAPQQSVRQYVEVVMLKYAKLVPRLEFMMRMTTVSIPTSAKMTFLAIRPLKTSHPTSELSALASLAMSSAMA